MSSLQGLIRRDWARMRAAGLAAGRNSWIAEVSVPYVSQWKIRLPPTTEMHAMHAKKENTMVVMASGRGSVIFPNMSQSVGPLAKTIPTEIVS